MSDLIQSEDQLFETLMETLREANRLAYPRHQADAELKRALDAYIAARVRHDAEVVGQTAIDRIRRDGA